NTLDGSSLFGYMVSEEWRPQPKPAGSALGRASVWLRDHLPERRSTGFGYVFGALLLAFPLWWKSRAARFSLVFIEVAWLAMALPRDAGAAVHHVVLLWPLPILFVVTAVGQGLALRRHRRSPVHGAGSPVQAEGLPHFATAAMGVILIALNLSVLN